MNPGPVLRLDLDGVILRANVSARKVFRTDDLLGTRWLDLCPGMTRQRWAQALASSEPTLHETMVHDCCLLFAHVRRPGGDQVFVYGSDITERRKAEQTLAAQARELAELARFPERNPGAVCRLDREGTVLTMTPSNKKWITPVMTASWARASEPGHETCERTALMTTDG